MDYDGFILTKSPRFKDQQTYTFRNHCLISSTPPRKMREHQRLEEEADFDFQGTAWDLVRSAQQRKRVVFAIKDDYVYKQDNLWILYIYIRYQSH